ncbi:MAG TPA: hypothetical protein PLA41_01960 [Candidatus Pacearchaeota archaeon]|nr:hypothetical protein [Candidatus Pacearchaeota archaeon]HQI74689.1 hypothetical protein [Candidatus Pacearchaeota archaeon]
MNTFYNQGESFSHKGLLAQHWTGKTKNLLLINLFYIDGELQATTGKFKPFVDLKHYGIGEEWRKTNKLLGRKNKYYSQGRAKREKMISFENAKEIQDAQGRLRCNDCVHGSCNNCRNQKDWAFHCRQEPVNHSEIYNPMRGEISSDPDIRYYGYLC